MASKKRNLCESVADIFTLALVRIFGQSYQSTTLELGTGSHEIVVKTDLPPLRVWLTFGTELEDGEATEAEVTLPVCQGNVDKVGFDLREDGFVLYADIHSTHRTVRWFATF